MSNLAIVIGVSEYKDQENLPACKNDAQIIHSILSESKKFDDILNIDGYVSGREVKSKVSEFVRGHENEKVEEIFFYFSTMVLVLLKIFGTYCQILITITFIQQHYRTMS